MSFLGKILKYTAIGGAAVATVATLPILLGFGSAGIVAGSVAAGIQSAIGNVAAGSAFAWLTSLGMTGTLATTATVGGAVGIGGAAGAAYVNRRNR